MRNKFSINCFLCLLLLVTSCSDDDYFLPKPKSYFRIDLPEKKYEATSTELPFSFEKPIFSIIQKRKSINQFNLVFPLHKAKESIDKFKDETCASDEDL